MTASPGGSLRAIAAGGGVGGVELDPRSPTLAGAVVVGVRGVEEALVHLRREQGQGVRAAVVDGHARRALLRHQVVGDAGADGQCDGGREQRAAHALHPPGEGRQPRGNPNAWASKVYE